MLTLETILMADIKIARTALLVHLIMQTPQIQIKPHEDSGTWLYAQDLLQALDEKKADFKGDRWSIIEEIIRVRTLLEGYENEYCGK